MKQKHESPVRAISRAQFLRGDFSGKRVALRPPWAVTENTFIDLCNGCGECIAHCPTGILHKGRGGYPVVDFSRGECEFCGECVNRCQTGALQVQQNETGIPWRLKAYVGDECLAMQKVVCRTCAEQCEAGAIRFRLQAGRVPQPELDLSLCNGCGACYAPCPVNAISICEPAA